MFEHFVFILCVYLCVCVCVFMCFLFYPIGISTYLWYAENLVKSNVSILFFHSFFCYRPDISWRFMLQVFSAVRFLHFKRPYQLEWLFSSVPGFRRALTNTEHTPEMAGSDRTVWIQKCRQNKRWTLVR